MINRILQYIRPTDHSTTSFVSFEGSYGKISTKQVQSPVIPNCDGHRGKGCSTFERLRAVLKAGEDDVRILN